LWEPPKKCGWLAIVNMGQKGDMGLDSGGVGDQGKLLPVLFRRAHGDRRLCSEVESSPQARNLNELYTPFLTARSNIFFLTKIFGFRYIAIGITSD